MSSGVRTAVFLAFFAVLLGATVPAQAVPQTIVLSGPDFSGPTNNTGGNITVNIVDIGGAGSGDVQLTVTNNLADAGAFLGALFLNTTAAPLASPSAACVNCTATGGSLGTVDFGSDAFQADGDGRYDIRLSLPTDEAGRLTPGESITFNILTSSAGFDADSFITLSAPGGGAGPFIAAAHIQSLPPNGSQSDWIAGNVSAVPEPGTLSLIGSGLVALGAALRRRKR